MKPAPDVFPIGRPSRGGDMVDKMAVTVEDALLALARLCLLTYHVQGTAVTRLPTPDARQKAILDALGTPLPPSRSLHRM